MSYPDAEEIVGGMLAELGYPVCHLAEDADSFDESVLTDPDVIDVFWSGYGQPYGVVRRVADTVGGTPT